MSYALPPVEEVRSQAEARQIAIDWQHWQSQQSLSWGEVMTDQDYFEKLAAKFDLVEEFKENGII